MKTLFFAISIFFSIHTFAQPGDIFGMRESEYQYLNEQLKNDPNNYDLIWEKIQLTSDFNYTIHFKGNINETPLPYLEKYSFSQYNYKTKLQDINLLIETNHIIKQDKQYLDKADFIFTRGMIYYALGEKEKALKDYLFALDNLKEAENKTNYIYKKSKICLAIAAYYYNSGETILSQEDLDKYQNNMRQALKYLDIVSPIEFITDFTAINIKSIYEPFENEKFNILTYFQDDARLEKYLVQMMRYKYEIFKQNENPLHFRNHHNSEYMNVLIYMEKLATYYYSKGNFIKAKFWAEKQMNNCPNINGTCFIYYYDFKRPSNILFNIAKMEFFKDINLEINSLLGLFGNINGGADYHRLEIQHTIKNLVELYPKDGRLYLADALLKYQDKGNHYFDSLEYAGQILDLLAKADSLNLQDYRVPYLRATIYDKTLKQENLALIEVDKALSIEKNDFFLCQLKQLLMLKIEPTNYQSSNFCNENYIQFPDLKTFFDTYTH